MKCPKCEHVSEKVFLKCSACGETFEREAIERLSHLEFLLAWLDKRAEKLGPEEHSRIRNEVIGELSVVRQQLRLAPTIPVPEVVAPAVLPMRPLEEVARELKYLEIVLDHIRDWGENGSIPLENAVNLCQHLIGQSDRLKEQLQGHEVHIMPPPGIEAANFALQMLPTWSGELQFKPAFETSLRKLLKQKCAEILMPEKAMPTPFLETEPVVAVEPGAEIGVVLTPAPAHPERPKSRFDWSKWWERTWAFATSGTMMRGLLYLGAFMIVVSTAVLVIRFWDIFPQIVQLLFIASVPTVFYLTGWWVRTRLKLLQAGSVLSGIGSLLVAVDFAAVYQFGGLAGRIDPTAYWLGASFICTVIYVLSAWRLPTEFFGYITLVGAVSTLLAFTQLLRAPLEWQAATIATLATGVVEGAARLERIEDRWGSLARAGRRSALVLLSANVVLVPFIPGDAALGQMVTFLLATLGFALLARHFLHVVYTHAAFWSSVGVFAFLFKLSALPGEWLGTTVGVLVILYGLARQGVRRQFHEDSELWIHVVSALNLAHWILITISVVAGIAALSFDLWPGIISLTLTSLLLGWSAYLYRRPILVLVAAAIFLLPFSLAVCQWTIDFKIVQTGAWLMTGWSGLALVYLGVALALRKLEEYGRWLNLVAYILTPTALFGLMINFMVTSQDWFNGPTLVALGVVICVYAASALIHDSDRHPALSKYLTWLPDRLRKTIFLWPIGLLIPIWMTIAWLGSVLVPSWLGAALAGLGLIYVGIGEGLARRNPDYRLTPHVYAYPLGVIGILAALDDRWALLTTLYLVVGVFASLAVVYRRAWEVAFAGLLFVWPFQLSLELSPLTTHAYSLTYALLASLGYIPLGVILDRTDRKLALPLYSIGYALAATAVVLSMLGRFDVYAVDVPWLGVAPPLIVTGLLVFSVRHFGKAVFSWAAVTALPIAFGQALTLFRVPSQYDGLAWVGLAFTYLLLERLVTGQSATESRIWYHRFRSPLVVGAAVLTALGLALTTADTFAIFFGIQDQGHLPLILTQTLAIGLVIITARVYINRWLLYIASVLSFFPYTLTWMGYGPDLTIAQFSWVWMGLTVVLLATGFALDRSDTRHSHGPYLVGYLLGGFALAWSAQDRHTNLFTLGAIVLLSVLSQWLVHVRRHRAFEDFIDFIWEKPSVDQRAACTTFLFAAAIGFPIWLIQLLTYHDVSLAWRGLALALTAPLYIALGLVLKRVRSEYAWPFCGVGYILTVIGAMIAFEDQVLGIYVLALDAIVYAASAYIFRQPFWLYLSNVLFAVILLLTLHYKQALIAPWIASTFMGLAFIYFATGFLLNRRKHALREGIDPFALPFFAPSYLLSAVALAVASSEKILALGVYSSGVLFFAISAWAFRESMFLYPAAWLAAVPYYLGLTLSSLPPDWYGIGWLPLIVAYIALGRFVFQKASLRIADLPALLRALTHPGMPFYIMAYTLSMCMIVLSQDDPLILSLAFTAGSVIYFVSSALFRHPGWLYAGLLTTHLAVRSAYALIPFHLPVQYITLPYLMLTWIVAWIGYGFAKRFPILGQTGAGENLMMIGKYKIDLSKAPLVGHLLTHSWAQPFFLFAVVDLVLWQAVAMAGFDTAILLAIANAILLGIFATLWQDKELTYIGIALFLLAVGGRLGWTGMPLAEGLAWLSGIGFGLYFLSLLIEHWAKGVVDRLSTLRVWLRPLTHTSIFLTAIAVLGTLPQVQIFGVAVTSALGFAGVLYLTIAYRGRHIRLSYLGLAMLELDWALMLIDQGVKQPQLYAIPAGLYFVLLGYLEHRQGRKLFATLVENFGLAVLIVTSFIQSLNGVQGFPYFLLLLVEGVAVTLWGGVQKRKVPFFAGMGASVINIVSQVIILVNVYDVQRWIIILGVGILLVTAAVFVERQREHIMARVQEWREELETWD